MNTPGESNQTGKQEPHEMANAMDMLAGSRA